MNEDLSNMLWLKTKKNLLLRKQIFFSNDRNVLAVESKQKIRNFCLNNLNKKEEMLMIKFNLIIKKVKKNKGSNLIIEVFFKKKKKKCRIQYL